MNKLDFRKYCLIIVSLILVFSDAWGQSGAWTKFGDMPENRYGHTVDEINGKIYVIGGAVDELSAYSTHSLVYDRATGEWSQMNLYNNSVRGAHSSCVVDGKLYIVGGNNGVRTVATMEMFDPNTGEWTSKMPMPTDRGLTACTAINDKIFVIGGIRGTLPWDFDWAGVNTVEVYDVKNNSWTQAADMPTKRWGHSAITTNGKIYVFGGTGSNLFGSIEVYNPQTNTWTTNPNTIPTLRYCFTSCLLDSNIYVIGGWQHSSYGPIYDKVETYNFEKDEWKTEYSLPVTRAVLASTVIDGKIYVFGGARTTHPNYGTSAIYEYDPAYVIPVELTSFTGNIVDAKVLLEWKTATELNNYGFEIQRKTFGGDFATIAFVKGQGTTTQQNEYSFTDKNLDEGKYFYRLKQMDYSGQYNYSQTVEVDVRTLDKFALEQNYPNPFNPTTTIGYVLQEKSNVKLTLLNAIGEEIAVIVNEEQDKGYHKVEIDGSKLSSGVYFYQLKAGSFVETKKLVLLR